MAQHWAQVGFGTPVILHLFCVVKILAYAAIALMIVLLTPGIGGLGEIAHWWTEPIVLEKVVLFTMLFEVIGLGCGFGPLNNRFFPPMGSVLYWFASEHHPAATVARTYPTDPRDIAHPRRRRAVCRSAGDAGGRAVRQRNRADPGDRQHARGTAGLGGSDGRRPCWPLAGCETSRSSSAPAERCTGRWPWPSC